jgi:MucR family transcriptional regulator, transcriptional regulator of exopolysaccharide biosynthesis
MNNDWNNPFLTTKIVSKYVGHHTVAASELATLISTIHQALGNLRGPPEPQETRTPAVPVRRSVHPDYVICLDCGFRGVTLRRHIHVSHGLTPDEYRRRWGLKENYLLTAPAYSERRSTVAKALGFGRKASTVTTVTPKPAAPAVPDVVAREDQPAAQRASRSRRGSAAPAKDQDAATTAPATAKRGRPRSSTRRASAAGASTSPNTEP